MKLFFFLFAVLYVLSGCTASHKAMDAREDQLFNKWLNHSKSDLIKAWGQPDSIFSNGNRGERLLYKERTDAKSVMNGTYTGTQLSYRKEMFVNADSIIYHWRSWRRK